MKQARSARVRPGGGELLHILLVEDDAVFASIVRQLLDESWLQAHETSRVSTLAEAVVAVRDTPVDVVLLDLGLPDSDGLETFDMLHREAPRLPIVVLTANDDENWPVQAIQRGAQDYLPKAHVDGRLLGRVVRYAVERRHAEEVLREREDFYRLITDNVTDMIAVLDREGRRLYNSQSYRHMFGDPLALRGTNSFAEIHPEDRAEIQRVFAETIRTGVGRRAEFRFVLPGGEVRHIESIGTVIQDIDGRPDKVVVVSRDISERKGVEAALRQSEQRYRRLLDSITSYMFTVKIKDGLAVSTVHGQGCEAVTGYTPEDYTSDPNLWYRMVHPEDREAVLTQARRVMEGGALPSLEHRIFHKDGSIRWIEHTAVPHFDAAGRLDSYDGLITEITRRKEYEGRLREALEDLRRSHEELQAAQLHLIQAEKLESVGTLAAGVAHEVKNPLQILLMGLRYLTTQFRGADAGVQQTLEDMRMAVSRADAIVRGLLEFSSSHKLEMRPCSLNEVVAQALQLAHYELKHASVEVVSELDPGLPLLRLDRIKMEQVIINLVMNAVHAMPGGGRIVLRTGWRKVQDLPMPPKPRMPGGALQTEARTVFAEIEDTGLGIPEDTLRRIFDPFFTTKPVGKGTGLGLTVVRNILEWHGGCVDIRNRAEGGVRVTLIFDPETIQTS